MNDFEGKVLRFTINCIIFVNIIMSEHTKPTTLNVLGSSKEHILILLIEFRWNNFDFLKPLIS